MASEGSQLCPTASSAECCCESTGRAGPQRHQYKRDTHQKAESVRWLARAAHQHSALPRPVKLAADVLRVYSPEHKVVQAQNHMPAPPLSPTATALCLPGYCVHGVSPVWLLPRSAFEGFPGEATLPYWRWFLHGWRSTGRL